MASISPQLGRSLAAYRALLEREFGARLLEVRLFGSQARGDAGPESDADVAVIVREMTDPEMVRVIDLAYAAWSQQGHAGPMIAPLPWSDAEYAACLGREKRIALDVRDEGVPV
jgi:hypothetical protein